MTLVDRCPSLDGVSSAYWVAINASVGNVAVRVDNLPIVVVLSNPCTTLSAGSQPLAAIGFRILLSGCWIHPIDAVVDRLRALTIGTSLAIG